MSTDGVGDVGNNLGDYQKRSNWGYYSLDITIPSSWTISSGEATIKVGIFFGGKALYYIDDVYLVKTFSNSEISFLATRGVSGNDAACLLVSENDSPSGVYSTISLAESLQSYANAEFHLSSIDGSLSISNKSMSNHIRGLKTLSYRNYNYLQNKPFNAPYGYDGHVSMPEKFSTRSSEELFEANLGGADYYSYNKLRKPTPWAINSSLNHTTAMPLGEFKKFTFQVYGKNGIEI